MKENKYWFIILILESILILLLLDISKDLVKHGNMWIGRGIQISVFIYIFYCIKKNFEELIN